MLAPRRAVRSGDVLLSAAMWSWIVLTVGSVSICLLACGNSKRSSPDPVSDLLAQRVVVLRGEIDERAATELIAKLLFLRGQDAVVPVRLQIDSPGGEVIAGLAIRDTMDDIKLPVYTHCLSSAQGIAAVLLAHGARGHRTATSMAQISFTPIASAGVSSAQDERARAKAIIVEMLAKDTGQNAQQLADDLQASRRFDGEQARSYGLIDRIGN